MALFQIVFRLARNPGFPNGDDTQGYVVTAPLDRDGLLDAGEWRRNREACTVIRFKLGDDKDANGWLTHNGSHWFFHYDEPYEGADQPVYRLKEHRLNRDAYVTVDEGDHHALTYRITQVQPHHPPRQAKRQR